MSELDLDQLRVRVEARESDADRHEVILAILEERILALERWIEKLQYEVRQARFP